MLKTASLFLCLYLNPGNIATKPSKSLHNTRKNKSKKWNYDILSENKTMEVWIALGVLALIGGLIALVSKSPAQKLNENFINLGTLTGKTYDQISQVAGAANSISHHIGADGSPIILRQWIVTGYHICLLFDTDDVCLGVSSETRIDTE